MFLYALADYERRLQSLRVAAWMAPFPSSWPAEDVRRWG